MLANPQLVTVQPLSAPKLTKLALCFAQVVDKQFDCFNGDTIVMQSDNALPEEKNNIRRL